MCAHTVFTVNMYLFCPFLSCIMHWLFYFFLCSCFSMKSLSLFSFVAFISNFWVLCTSTLMVHTNTSFLVISFDCCQFPFYLSHHIIIIFNIYKLLLNLLSFSFVFILRRPIHSEHFHSILLLVYNIVMTRLLLYVGVWTFHLTAQMIPCFFYSFLASHHLESAETRVPLRQTNSILLGPSNFSVHCSY